MGLFSRKLDYSTGNGVLPKVDSSEYSTLSLPNTSLMRAPNLNLMVKERDQGNLEKAFGASADAFLADGNDAACRVTIEKYLAALRARTRECSRGYVYFETLLKFKSRSCTNVVL